MTITGDEYRGSPHHMGFCGGLNKDVRSLLPTLVEGRWAWVNAQECTVCGEQSITAKSARALERGEGDAPWFPTSLVGTVLVAST